MITRAFSWIWVGLLLACGSQPRTTTQHAEPQVEPEAPVAEAPVEAPAEPLPVLPEIAEPTRIEWPEQFLGRPVADLIADSTARRRQPGLLMSLYRDEGHRAFEMHLVPIDETSGWIIDRGTVTSPDGAQSLYERWSRVQLRGDELVILSQVGRGELGDAPRSPAHEDRYDALVAHHEHCVANCQTNYCPRQCTSIASGRLTNSHSLTLGDARVRLFGPEIHIERGGHLHVVDDIDNANIVDHPTRPVPFFARVRRRSLDADRDVIVIGYGHGCDEDAFCYASRVFLLEDAGIREVEGEFRSAAQIELPGDGTIRWTGGASRTCEPTRRQRESHYASVEPDMADPEYWWWHQRREIRLGVRVGGDGSIRELRARPRPWLACTASIAAACPYVDLVTDEGTTRVGEILRWIRDEPATQGLALPRLQGRNARIRLSEEKLETTYLDAVWLELDGERVDPIGRDLAADGRYAIMQRGDSIDLVFPLHPHTEARLVAVGYYVVVDGAHPARAARGVRDHDAAAPRLGDHPAGTDRPIR